MLCCYAPLTPRRKRKRSSPGRTPKRTRHHRRRRDSSSDYSGSDSISEEQSDSGYGSTGEHYSDAGTEEEDYDIEAARTPPRGTRQSQWDRNLPETPSRSPPRTPKIHYGSGKKSAAPKTPEGNVRHESYINPCDRSKGETPTRTLVIYKDFPLTNGKTHTEVTSVVLPMYDDEAAYNTQQSPKKSKASPMKHRPFPVMSEDTSRSISSSPRKGGSGSKSASKSALGRPPSIATSPLRNTRLPGKRAPGSNGHHQGEHAIDHHDHTDQTVSTMTCSMSGHPLQLQSPHAPPRPPPPPLRLQVTPERRAVASPESETSPMRTHNAASPSKASGRTRRVERYCDETEYSHMDSLEQNMRTPERASPQKCRPSDRKHVADDVSESHTQRTSSATKKNRPRREPAEHSSVMSEHTGVTEDSPWTIHTHRSGRIFYHNEQ